MKPIRGRPRYDQENTEAAQTFASIADSLDLNRADSRPLWVQIRNQLESAINDGLLAPNMRLPSEQAMCEFFAVSKPVVRAAIAALASEGKVLKFPRKGMFVAAPQQYVDFMTTNLGVFGDLGEKGHNVTVRNLELYRTRANNTEREIFGMDNEMDVVRIKRVYSVDGRPITLTHIMLPAHRVPGMENEQLENRSVFSTIKEKYGLSVTHADRWLASTLPTEEEAQRLKIAMGTPLISIRSVAREAKGAPLEYYEALYNSNVAEIHLVVGKNPLLQPG